MIRITDKSRHDTSLRYPEGSSSKVQHRNDLNDSDVDEKKVNICRVNKNGILNSNMLLSRVTIADEMYFLSSYSNYVFYTVCEYLYKGQRRSSVNTHNFYFIDVMRANISFNSPLKRYVREKDSDNLCENLKGY